MKIAGSQRSVPSAKKEERGKKHKTAETRDAARRRQQARRLRGGVLTHVGRAVGLGMRVRVCVAVVEC